MSEDLFFLGVDGGATNCRARLADRQGHILGEGSGGAASTRLGVDTTFAAILEATRGALDAAGLSNLPLNRVHAGLGLAGLALQSDIDKVMAHDHPFANVTAQNDAYIACLGAHAGADGGIFIFGTGSCGCAILDGRALYVGGWGFHISDDGSAAQLGLKALRQALLAHDEVIPATDFSRAMMTRFDNSPERAVLWASEATPGDYGGLAPLVSEYADKGDTLAREIMAWSASGANRFLRTLHAKGAQAIALVGGFSPVLEPWLADDVRRILVAAKGDAMDGALVMARRAWETGGGQKG